MESMIHQNGIEELIECLEKRRPKPCSKPKDEMCGKCVKRVFGEKAQIINGYVDELNKLKTSRLPIPAVLETEIVDFLNR